MRKQIFTVLAALGGLVYVNAADVTDYAGLKAALSGGDTEIRMAVGVYTIPVGEGELVIPSTKKVIGGYTDFSGGGVRIYPGAATSTTEMTILDGNSLIKTAPADKHRVATVQGTLEGVVIRNGHARRNGGGVLIDGGIVLNCIIKGNVAMDPVTNDAKGGGAYLQGTDAKLINCIVAYNMANNGYGVAGTGDVINNTITANTYAPSAVAITGGTYKHFKHWKDENNMPWETFDSSNDLDAQEITVSNFSIAETQTTNSQYAVFAAAMDLTITVNAGVQDVSFLNTTKLSTLTDPFRNENVGTYLGFTSTGNETLFQSEGSSSYGLLQIGKDFIYYSARSNEAMTFVTWHGALAYCLWIGGTLPTEGQWEYAARYNGSGLDNTLYAGADNIIDLNNVAWYSGNSGAHVKDVATRIVNGAGLYDMTGNVWEWCADFINVTTPTGTYPNYTTQGVPYNTLTDPIWNTGTARVRRGASFSGSVSASTIAYRGSNTQTFKNAGQGFRPVLVP